MTHQEELAVCLEKWKQVDQRWKVMDRHIQESVLVRDRLKDVELKLIIIQQQVLRNAIIGGIIGALIGSAAPQAITSLVGLLL